MPHYYTYDSNLRDRNKFTSTVETTFGTKRYFSQLDTEVYFGAVQIDEMVAIDFTIAEPKLPIYGYNSFYPNRIVSGRRTVQGTFAINFTHTTYLLNILNSIDDSVMANDYEALIYRCPEEDSTGLGIGNSAIFNKMFDITLSYGYGKTEGMQTYNSCFQTLVGVQIVDYRQALDTEGNPILDMYSFIAKDIRYHDKAAEDEVPKPDDEIKKCPACGKPISECVCNDNSISPSKPQYIVANKYIDGDMNELTSKTTNTEVAGFIVHPLIYKSNNEYYMSLCIETVNNDTETFKDVKVSIAAKSIGVNFSFEYKNLKNGVTKAQVFAGSMRESVAKLMKEYETEKGYGAIYNLSFTATINDKEITIPFCTYLIDK